MATTLALSALLLTLPFGRMAKAAAANSGANDTADDVWSYWDLVAHFNVSEEFSVAKYRSDRTNLTVVLSQAQTPLVNGHFCLATESFDDDGLPHALEHLIFSGSEERPYKDYLSQLGSRNFAKVTAKTMVDHTCFLVEAAGGGGFAAVLEALADAVFFPALRDQDFLTEVHHVTGDGEDSGVVYSEMQGKGAKDHWRVHRAMLRAVFSENSSYAVNYGGALKNLRDSTTIEKIREYHGSYYRPENMYVIITGQVDPEDIFRALDKVEKKLLKRSHPNFKKPFTETYPEVKEDANVILKSANPDGRHGVVFLAWRLPYNLRENPERTRAVKIIVNFLTSTRASPLREAFRDDGGDRDLLSTYLKATVVEFRHPAVVFYFYAVPVGRMGEVEDKFRSVVGKIVADGPDRLEMDRIRTFVRREMVDDLINIENGPRQAVPGPATKDLVYGMERGDLQRFVRAGQQESARALLEKPPQFWLNLTNETFSAPRACGLVFPDANVSSIEEEKEIERARLLRARLGPEGLKAAGAALRAAVESQKATPKSVLDSAPMANASKIFYRSIESYNAATPEQPMGFNISSIPFRFHLDHVKGKFIRVYVFLNATGKVRGDDGEYFQLLEHVWLKSPLRVDGELGSIQETMERTIEDLVSLSNYQGFREVPPPTNEPNIFFDTMTFEATMVTDKYREGIKLLQDVLFNVEFTEETTSLLKDYMRHQSFENISLQMDRDPLPLFERMHELAKELVLPDSVAVYMAADVDRLAVAYGDEAAGIWKEFYPKDKYPASAFPSRAALEEKRLFKLWAPSMRENPPPFRHTITGASGLVSCHLHQTVDLPLKDREGRDLAALRVALQYITEKIFTDVRGKGLLYKISMEGSTTDGRIKLKMSRASQLSEAYEVFRRTLRDHLNSSFSVESVWDESALVSAKGREIFDLAEKEETVEGLVKMAAKSFLLGDTDAKHNRRFVGVVSSVTMDEVRRAAEEHLADFLNPDKTLLAAKCANADVESNRQYLNSVGFDVEVNPEIPSIVIYD